MGENYNVEDGNLDNNEENQGINAEENLAILSEQETLILLNASPQFLKPTMQWNNIQVSIFRILKTSFGHLLHQTWYNLPTDEVSIVHENGWASFFENEEPTVQLVLSVTMASDRNLALEYLITVLANIQPGHSIPYKIVLWIYILMLFFSEPIPKHINWFLRCLAFNCFEIRANLNGNDINARRLVKPLNLFICLVALHFHPLQMSA